MSELPDASFLVTGKAHHLQADGHQVMLQNQVTFYSLGHKNRLSLLQLEEKVQEDKHRHCAGLTTCPGDERAKDCACTCLEVVGNCFWRSRV